ncbi:hypothetical protein BCR35DRAFT_352140 [Leucosporidium creatinivorum]|uniref:Uncharacterized protein n=1 Tax=Leucosporidium creatinivorum TaxID=106004 RepID=A0A1Y2FGE6_9BASI|nr:hypothetical protein BCR35DRAFT_352140 [Leucosporidium creatinivorum]
MKAYQRATPTPVALDAATQSYLNYTLEAIRVCQLDARQRSTLVDSLATQRLLGDPATTPSHTGHLNLYLRACDALAIPPFPITTVKVILRLLATLPGARARKIVQAFPTQYKVANLRIPESAQDYMAAFQFIHKRTNDGLPGWPAGAEISRSEWSSCAAEIRWISDCAPAFPHFGYGISVELASGLPRLRAQAGAPALQQRAFSVAQAWLAKLPDSNKFAGIITRHGDFLKPLDVPLFPVTTEKLALDLVRRVNLPSAVEIYNTTRTVKDDLFRGFWSQKDVDEALDVLCGLGNITRFMWPSVPLLTKHHPHLVAIRLAAPVIEEGTSKQLPLPLRRPSSTAAPPTGKRTVSAGQPRSSEATSRFGSFPARPHSSHGMRADPSPSAPPPTAAPRPPTRPSSSQTIRTAPPPSSSASALVAAPTPSPAPAPAPAPTPAPAAQNFEAAYAALFGLDQPAEAEEPTASPTEPTRSVAVLPTPITSPPLRRVVSLPVPTTTSSSPTHLFPPTAALLSARPPSTTSTSSTNTALREGLKEAFSGPLPTLIPSKRAMSDHSALPNDSTAVALSKAKKQKTEVEAQAVVLEFCTTFANVFGGEGEVGMGEKKSLEEAVGELRSVMEGIEWIKG